MSLERSGSEGQAVFFEKKAVFHIAENGELVVDDVETAAPQTPVAIDVQNREAVKEETRKHDEYEAAFRFEDTSSGDADVTSEKIAKALKLRAPLESFSQQKAYSPEAMARERAERMLRSSPTPSPAPSEIDRGVHYWLCNVPHLCTLSFDEISKLDIMIREYGPLDLVIDKGAPVQHVYIIANGQVEVFATKELVGLKRVGTITSPNIFMMEQVMLDQPSQFLMRAGARTSLILIPKQQFAKLVRSSKFFAHSIGHKMIENTDIYLHFQNFCRAIFASSTAEASRGEGNALDLRAILSSYRRIPTVVHMGLNDPDKIDVEGWRYAVRRLPENITDCFIYCMGRSLPPYILAGLEASGHDQRAIRYVQTSSRRRCCWQFGNGENFVLLREGFTDVLDFITCLCIHLVEANKIRVRLQGMVKSSALSVIQNALASTKRNFEKLSLSAAVGRNFLGQLSCLSELPFSREEREGLLKMWPESLLQHLLSIAMYRGEYTVRLDNSLARRFDTDPYAQWAISLRRQVLKCLGHHEMDPIPDFVKIHVLSGNTTITKNCLCGYVRRHREDLLKYGSATKPDVMELPWENEEDLLYYMCASAIRHDNAVLAQVRSELIEDGFIIIEDSVLTGLQVDIVDVSKLKLDTVDKTLRNFLEAHQASSKKDERVFILNLDFAFGAQADGITRALILTFGKQIESLNVVGQAAGLVGSRGDLLLPDSLMFAKGILGVDVSDEIRKCGNDDLLKSRVQELAKGRAVHQGRCLTYPGVLLQNTTLLHYYITMWECIGFEMEGSYFARQVEESIALQLLPSTVKQRYIYWTSNLPLSGPQYSRLASVPPAVAVPAMYSASRAIFELILAP